MQHALSARRRKQQQLIWEELQRALEAEAHAANVGSGNAVPAGMPAAAVQEVSAPTPHGGSAASTCCHNQKQLELMRPEVNKFCTSCPNGCLMTTAGAGCGNSPGAGAGRERAAHARGERGGRGAQPPPHRR